MTVTELRKALQGPTGSWGLPTRKQRIAMILFFAEHLVNIEKALVSNGHKPKRPATAWQKFFAAGMKAGKAPALIGEEWRARKAGRVRRSE